MKIAIDCRSLRKQPVGVPNFLLSVINTIAHQQTEWTVYLLSNENFATQVQQRLTNVPQVVTIISPFILFRRIAILWYIFKVPSIIRKLRPDIFYTPIPNLPFFLPKYVKTFITVHDMVYKRYPQTMSSGNWWINFFLHDRSIRKADMVWAVSDYTKNEIELFFKLRKSKNIVTGSSVDKGMFSKKRLPMESKTFNSTITSYKNYILFAGTLEPRKNLDFLISLMPALVLQGFSLVIVGAKGWGKNSSVTTLKLHKDIKEKIHFLGFVSSPELVTLYQNASIYVSTAINEGFGLPQLEAMCCGCPVVSPHNSAMIEVVEGAGETVKGWNREEWISTIAKVSGNREFYINRGYARADLYNWTTVISRVTDYINSHLK